MGFSPYKLAIADSTRYNCFMSKKKSNTPRIKHTSIRDKLNLRLVVKTTWSEHGEPHQDYQLLQPKPSSSELAELQARARLNNTSLKQELMEYIRQNITQSLHTERREHSFTVEVFDADNLPPDAIPDGTTFPLPEP